MNQKKNVLFIGNSYTNQISKVLLELLEISDFKGSEFKFITSGGATLDQHLKEEDTIETLQKYAWDVVVLQEQSQLPSLEGKYKKMFHDAVDRFGEIIASTKAEAMLYMTWGHKNGDAENSEISPDYPTMQTRLSENYRDAAKRCKMKCIEVGNVWSKVRESNKDLGERLYQGDGSHPSSHGAILAASVVFNQLTGDALDRVDFYDRCTAEDWLIIKKAILEC